ncbi:hypothetical protein OC842_001266 [Tilletia horrida]|uniref:DUF2433 domain-containing protein n=1 Tax=Tilletia horrida TaxID=155126 RepID=A0AAN6JME8_9BASI|nr:hypothetical protein OC842_001266 [Tilletia horrida]
MRLLTHNLLACHAKACASTSNNFPLQLENVQLEVAEVDMEEDFVRGLLPKIDWRALVLTARTLGDSSLPEQEPDLNDPMLDAALLKALHHVLLEVHVMEGQMRCPNCSRIFQIRNGIPSMPSTTILAAKAKRLTRPSRPSTRQPSTSSSSASTPTTPDLAFLLSPSSSIASLTQVQEQLQQQQQQQQQQQEAFEEPEQPPRPESPLTTTPHVLTPTTATVSLPIPAKNNNNNTPSPTSIPLPDSEPSSPTAPAMASPRPPNLQTQAPSTGASPALSTATFGGGGNAAAGAPANASAGATQSSAPGSLQPPGGPAQQPGALGRSASQSSHLSAGSHNPNRRNTGPPSSTGAPSVGPQASISPSTAALQQQPPYVISGSFGRILCVADVRGALSTLNTLAEEANAQAIIHTGDFGFYESASLDRMGDRTLRHLVQYSSLITPAIRQTLGLGSASAAGAGAGPGGAGAQGGSAGAGGADTSSVRPSGPGAGQPSAAALREAILNYPDPLFSEFPLLLNGKLRLNVPVFTVWGACEDVAVLERFRTGEYAIHNLHILDEASTRAIEVGGVRLRLFGLGGAVVLHKLFDNGDGAATIAGGQGTMWTTMLQIGELVDTAQKVYDPTETRLLITHASPGRDGLLAQLALALKADLTISAGLHFRYGVSYNEFSVQHDFENYRNKLIHAKSAFGEIWEAVKGQVDAVIDDKQRVLLNNALAVTNRVPSLATATGAASEEPAWKNTWNWNLPDAAYGRLVLEVRDGRVSAETKSQGFNFAYRRNNMPMSAATPIAPNPPGGGLGANLARSASGATAPAGQVASAGSTAAGSAPTGPRANGANGVPTGPAAVTGAGGTGAAPPTGPKSRRTRSGGVSDAEAGSGAAAGAHSGSEAAMSSKSRRSRSTGAASDADGTTTGGGGGGAQSGSEATAGGGGPAGSTTSAQAAASAGGNKSNRGGGNANSGRGGGAGRGGRGGSARGGGGGSGGSGGGGRGGRGGKAGGGGGGDAGGNSKPATPVKTDGGAA